MNFYIGCYNKQFNPKLFLKCISAASIFELVHYQFWRYQDENFKLFSKTV
jgi:hypothetical protein